MVVVDNCVQILLAVVIIVIVELVIDQLTIIHLNVLMLMNVLAITHAHNNVSIQKVDIYVDVLMNMRIM
jgi:hypothetical protein